MLYNSCLEEKVAVVDNLSLDIEFVHEVAGILHRALTELHLFLSLIELQCACACVFMAA